MTATIALHEAQESVNGLVRRRTVVRMECLANHFDSVWRFVRRMGMPAHVADDIVQGAFAIAAAKLERIDEGKERAYFFSTAIRSVRSGRRAIARESALDPSTTECDDPTADVLLDEARARVCLDQCLSSLDPDLRIVFVLHELEDLTMAEIADSLDVPRGTVASRLRRARELWREAIEAFHAHRQGAP